MSRMVFDRASSRQGAAASRAVRGDAESPSYLTLSQAARLAPGRPSSSATWRWCRKGLKARDGSSVFLKHVRVGRTVYTTAAWLHEFFEAVATADRNHFSTRNALAAEAVNTLVDAPHGGPHPRGGSAVPASPAGHSELDAALRAEGL